MKEVQVIIQMEHYGAKIKDLHIVFIDLKEAYDKRPIEVLWRTMTKMGIPRNTLI